jgi:hypothetical protein
MSTGLAIAAVTAVLKDLLQNGVIDHVITNTVGEVKVSALPPDRLKTDGQEASQLNLFLYSVTPNAAWRNAELPSRDAGGRSVRNPPLALDLHYLLTAYGAVDFHAEVLLGWAMQLLHETPVLTRDLIRKSLTPALDVAASGQNLPPQVTALAAADLAEQVEQIKVTPHYLNTEEMSKVWTALQAHYRPTTAYQVSVVLIDGRRPARAPLPVSEPRVHVLPFRRPVIESLSPLRLAAGETLVVQGQNLRGGHTVVRFLGGEATPVRVGDTRIEVALPATLPAGLQRAQVVHELDLGTPGDPHAGPESNAAPFVLAPRFAVPATPPPHFTVARGGTLTLDFTPPVGRAQKVALLVGDRTLTLPERLPSAPGAADATLDFVSPAGWPAGTFLMRVRVDGADSPLQVDPDTREYVGPRVQVT